MFIHPAFNLLVRSQPSFGRRKPDYKNNVADVRYQYTSGRHPLPEAINRFGPWMIRGRGKAR